MLETHSYGAVLYRKAGGHILFLLLKHANGGHWSLAKGHPEGSETEEQTALREILEETGLRVKLKKKFREEITYSPYSGVQKRVVFFLAKTKKKKVWLQEKEILNSAWLELEDALKLISHSDVSEVLQKAADYLSSKRTPAPANP
ncbi:MAG: NUDIX domain-containing protein [Spirochaetales bacterium]|nr:NUDIX domain-containing protein [Spirochaetales bacterium]